MYDYWHNSNLWLVIASCTGVMMIGCGKQTGLGIRPRLDDSVSSFLFHKVVIVKGTSKYKIHYLHGNTFTKISFYQDKKFLIGSGLLGLNQTYPSL